MNWFAVLAHHATRTPDKAITVFEGETHHLRRDGRPARTALAARPAPTRRRSWRRRWPSLVQLPRVPGDGLRRQLPRRHRHADQLAARRPRGPVHPRTLRGPRARVRRIASSVCADEATKGHGVLSCGRACRNTPSRRLDRSRRSARWPMARRQRCPAAADDVHRLMYTSGTTGRPKGVMITHANLAWKNLAHIIEFGFTECRSGTCLRTPLPRGRARPHHHLTDRRRRHDDHPPCVRRVRRRRRARAIAGDHGVAGTRHGQRHHGAARRRTTRPVVGAADHQRRREDADPAHRADRSARSRRHGSPMRTARPRRSPATPFSTATAS